MDAPSGTGKTFLINVILDSIRKDNNIAVATAASGIAGTLLRKGTTAHSKLKFPLKLFEDSSCGIKLNSKTAQNFKTAKLIVIDEGPMLHRHNFEALDRYLRNLMNSNEIFGGKLVLISGDF